MGFFFELSFSFFLFIIIIIGTANIPSQRSKIKKFIQVLDILII